MVVLIATPSREIIDLRDAIRASWTAAERKLRAQIAIAKQRELSCVLGLLPTSSADEPAIDALRSHRRRA